MRILLIIATAILIASCSTTNSTPKHPTSDTLVIYAEYITDTVWGIKTSSAVLRVVKDTHAISGDRVKWLKDTSYFIPFMLKVLDSSKKIVKAKDGGDSLSLVKVPIAKDKVRDLGDYEAYLKNFRQIH